MKIENIKETLFVIIEITFGGYFNGAIRLYDKEFTNLVNILGLSQYQENHSKGS